MRISPAAVLLRMLIRVYQLGVAPMLGPRCRFHPTCSAYASEAIAQHGALRGSGLAFKRLMRCHPWGGAGFDPVPPAASACAHTHPLASDRT